MARDIMGTQAMQPIDHFLDIFFSLSSAVQLKLCKIIELINFNGRQNVVENENEWIGMIAAATWSI